MGHSFGALFGGILSGVEKRIKTYILMAGVGSFTDVALLNLPDLKGEKLDGFRKTMNDIDPIHYVKNAAPSSFFTSSELRMLIIKKKHSLNFIMLEVSPNIFNGMKRITILTREPVWTVRNG